MQQPLCKIVSLGQKFKMPKTCEKSLYKNITVVLCQKLLEKTPNIREVRQFKKLATLQRLQDMQRVYPSENGQCGSKIKNDKNMQKKLFTRTLDLFCAKNRSKKHQLSAILQMFQPMQREQPLQNGQFGSKIENAKKTKKKPFYTNIIVVVCKKPLEETPNIREMRQF